MENQFGLYRFEYCFSSLTQENTTDTIVVEKVVRNFEFSFEVAQNIWNGFGISNDKLIAVKIERVK